jgi:hypothetical protein
MLQYPAGNWRLFMREIGSPSQLVIFLYAAGVLAVIFFLDFFGFSSNAIIAVSSSLTIAGATMMLWHFLRANSN